MTNTLRLASVSALALLLGGTAAFAQVGTITGTRALDDRIEDIEDDVQEDMDLSNDNLRFGNPEYRPGLSGSASLGYSGTDGNNEDQNLTIGARLRHAQGQFIQNIGVALDYQETDSDATKEDVFAVYDGNYFFDDRFYAFVLGRISTDGLADDVSDDAATPEAIAAELAGNVKTDAFIGVGPGYRVINRPDMAWRVQAGIGVSYLEYGDEESETETGYLASSRFFWAFNENVFMTNDTDILKSDTALRVNNDLGVNVKMTDAFSTRVSYLTDYNEARDIRTDNKLGVSLVYGF
ncbi:MAG: SspA [Cereibacter sp.]|jgi:putative salt-induced outer membrane protein|nr:SspA [Cereibacter sp.]